MRTLAALPALSLTLAMAGCDSGSADTQHAPWPTQHRSAQVGTGAAAQDDEGEIRVALAKLTPADRKLAEQQRWCAVQTIDRLGSMVRRPRSW